MKTSNELLCNTELLCIALGWQGGTVHQVAEATGLTVAEIVGTDRDAFVIGDARFGRLAIFTNSSVCYPKRQGNLAYWMGVAQGVEINSRLR